MAGGKLYYATMPVASLALLGGCVSEQERASNAAVDAVQRKHGVDVKLLSFVPLVGPDCSWGCSTDLCAVIQIGNADIAKRQIVFVRAFGMDDEAMHVEGEYASLAECQSHFDHG